MSVMTLFLRGYSVRGTSRSKSIYCLKRYALYYVVSSVSLFLLDRFLFAAGIVVGSDGTGTAVGRHAW